MKTTYELKLKGFFQSKKKNGRKFDRNIGIQNFANITIKEMKKFYTRCAKKRMASDRKDQSTIDALTRAKLTDFYSFTDKI